MTVFLKQSTAVTVKVGPFLDSTDGVTAETGLTISQADIRLAKNGGNIAQSNNATGGTHDELGYYDIPLDTTDTNTLGVLRLAIHEAGALPVWQDFMVMPANAWDSLFGADRLVVDVEEIGAGIITAAAVADGAIDAATFAAGAINAAAIATGAIDADALAADAAGEIADAVWDEARAGHVGAGSFGEGVASVQGNVTGSVGSVIGAVGSVTGNVGGNVSGSVGSVAAGGITAASIATGAVDADALAADAAGEIADAVWDEARAGHVGAGSFGEGVASVQGNVTGSVASVTGAVGSVTGNVGGNVNGSVGSVTAAVTVGVINAGAVNAAAIATGAIDADALAADAVTEIQAGLATSALIGVPAGASVSADIADIEGKVDDLEGRLTAGRAANLDNLDATVSSRLATAGYTVPPTAGDVADQVWNEAIADHLGAGSTGAALNGASAPSAATVADAVWDEAIAGHLGAGSTGAALNGASAPTAAAVADAVWEETLADHSGTVGSTAEALNAAGSADDPWVTVLPGAYGAGSAGNILGNRLDAAVSTRSTLTAADVWAHANRTLTSFGTLVSDIWSSAARTLTSFGTLVSDIWSNASRTLTASSDPTAAAIADAVWDEARAGHVAAGSFGQGVASVQGNVTGSAGSVAAAVTVGAINAGAVNAAAIATGAIDADALAADAVTEIQAGLATSAALAAVDDLVDDLEGRLTAARAGYLDNLSAGPVALQASVDSLEAGVIVTTNNDKSGYALSAAGVTAVQAGLSTLSAAQVNAEVVDVLRTDPIPDSVAADGAQPTISQAIYAIVQFLTEKSVAGTTLTVRKPDGASALFTCTLDDGAAPTSITRAP